MKISTKTEVTGEFFFKSSASFPLNDISISFFSSNEKNYVEATRQVTDYQQIIGSGFDEICQYAGKEESVLLDSLKIVESLGSFLIRIQEIKYDERETYWVAETDEDRAIIDKLPKQIDGDLVVAVERQVAVRIVIIQQSVLCHVIIDHRDQKLLVIGKRVLTIRHILLIFGQLRHFDKHISDKVLAGVGPVNFVLLPQQLQMLVILQCRKNPIVDEFHVGIQVFLGGEMLLLVFLDATNGELPHFGPEGHLINEQFVQLVNSLKEMPF